MRSLLPALLCALACPTLRAGIDLGITEPPDVMRVYADAGDPSAQFNLALLYQQGEGVEKDPAEAVAWYRKAAAGGFAQAQYNLGVLLANGDGVAKDDNAAAAFFFAAAQQGMFEAQKALIQCYILGRGVDKNPFKALRWDFLARRTLELRFELPAGAPPKPATLRPDGFAEYTTPDGKREAIGADGSIEHINADGTRTVDNRPDGGTTLIGAGNIGVTRYPDGRVRTDYPDGTSKLEGDVSNNGENFHVTEQFDKQNHLVSKCISDGVIITEDLPDGTHSVESEGEDDHGRKVKVIERFGKDGSVVTRRLVREDGVQRNVDEIWIVTRWIRGPDGGHIQVRETIGAGDSIQNQEVLQKLPRGAAVLSGIAGAAQAEHRATPAPAAPLPPASAAFEGIAYGQTTPAPAPSMVVIPRFGDFSPFRPKVTIDGQLADLAKLERASRYFAGVTDAQYEEARALAGRFLINLPLPPQKAQASSWLDQRIDELAAPPAPSPLLELQDDRSGVYPLGFNGREAIKLYPWKHAETEHFVVHYIKASDAYPVMRYIECAFFVVTRTLQIDPARANYKSHVFIFPDSSSWLAYTSSKGLPPQVEGFAYKDELLLGSYAERDRYIKNVCHEATHAIVAHFYPGRRWPLWLNEGFAEYMGARSVALRRDHQVARYLDPQPAGQTDVTRIFDRVRYGNPGPAQAVGMSDISQFYATSEKCVRVLLEQLPPEKFPAFANLAFAGDCIPACLGAAYGSACPDSAKFQALVNSTR
jgi:hypothetical protein